MDYVCLRDEVAQLVTAAAVSLNHSDGHSALQEHTCEIHGNAAAAHYHHSAHRLLVLAGGNKEFPQFLIRSGNAQQITAPEREVAVGDDCLTVPLHNTHQHLGVKVLGQLLELHSVQFAALFHPVLHYFGAALGKSVHPGSTGQAEDTGYLLCTLQLRVNYHRQAQGLPEKLHLSEISRVPYSGYHMLCTQLSGRYAADHVGLVAAGCGHEKIRLSGPGLQEGLGIGGAALHTYHVQIVGEVCDRGTVVVDDCYVVPLVCQDTRHAVAYLACAGNDYFHFLSPFSLLSSFIPAEIYSV